MNALVTLDEEYRDCLQEITNIAMGQAADRLATLLDTFVILSVPHIEMMKPSDIAMTLDAIRRSDTVSGVCQGFIGGGIAGEAILLFNDTSFTDIARLMNYEEELTQQAQCELLMDTTNVLFGAVLNSIAEQIDMTFSFGPPMVLGQNQRIEDLFDPEKVLWKSALVTELNYKVEGYDVNCDLLLIWTEDSIDLLIKKLDYLIN